MSAIYKLSIQGIRSFDSNDRETIEFGKPLTLIVGSNGSGKTTIIECLKYATTGDLPPNSKGGAFVHDPKITGEKDIRAQVKLAFNSANGLNMIVTRNIQLLVKKTTTTFKTLEGQLVSINKSGDRSTLSTRSQELDAQVPLYMGVPKAILEYVIFCHQEDSLWPLSEPANLKKKFDEIFQAMKFTKALDNLKLIKKDMSVDIKLLKQSVEHLKVDRDRSKVTKINISKLQNKNDKYGNQVREIELQLNEITEESDNLFKSNQDFQKVLSQLENLKRNRKSTSEQINRLADSIDVIDIPKGKLVSLLENFSITLKEKENEVHGLEFELNKLKDSALNLQGKSDKLLRNQGELQSFKDIYLKNLDTIKLMGLEFASSYGISFDETVSHETYLASLKHRYNQQQLQVKDFINTNTRHSNVLNERKMSLNNSFTSNNQKLGYISMDQNKIKETVQKLDNELKDMEYCDSDLLKEKENLSKLLSKLEDWEKYDHVSSLSMKVKSKNEELLLLEDDLENLQESIMKTNQQSDLYAKLSLLRKSFKEKQKLLSESELLFNEDKLVKLKELTVTKDLNMDFNKFYIKLQKYVGLNNKEQHEMNTKYTETFIKLSNIESDLLKTKSSIKQSTDKLTESLPEDCPINEYDEVMLEVETSYKTALENLKMHQTTLEFNRKALEIAESDDCCYLCSRKFNDNTFKSKLLQELKSKTDANFESTLTEAVTSEKEYLVNLRTLEKDIISLNSANEKLKDLNSSLVKEKALHDDLKQQSHEVEMKGNELKDDRDHSEKILRPLVDKIVRIKGEMKELDIDIQNITDELNVHNAGENGVKTVDELQSSQRTCNETLRLIRKEIGLLQEEKEIKSKEHSSLISLIKERSSKISEMEMSISRRSIIESEISNNRKEIINLELWESKLKDDIEILRKKLSDIEEEISIAQNVYNTTLEEKRNSTDSMEKDIDKFETLKYDIKKFEEEGKKSLDDCNHQLDSAKVNLESVKSAIDKATSILSEQTQKLNDSNGEKKNLKQNIELLDLRESLASIENKIETFDIKDAEVKRDQYQQESLRLRTKFEKLSSENAGKLGEMKQLQNQIDSLTNQLRTDYKDIDDQYHKEWVELQTKTFVTDDIDTYSKALDSAIMRYHGLKMQDINRIIDELWKRTYSGTDVDTIQIRSDEVGTSVKGKSYNYRVVMYKQDAELDMRGRCSAGQKVLASIIIRLALSETFGVNCGVIALDEPTTNLDEENIESLAKSLSNIIQFRMHQKNFQLIVITHDEKFLNHMGAAQFTDHFFMVKRDDRQKSLIEWVDINKVTE